MATSERLLIHIAKDFGVSEDELLAESLLEYLKSKKRDCMAEKLEILSRYGVSSASELEEAIGVGSVRTQNRRADDQRGNRGNSVSANGMRSRLCGASVNRKVVFGFSST